MIGALLIDLDDTLYEERSYVLSGFRRVAGIIAGEGGRLGADALYERMVADLDAHGRGRVFDQALEAAGLAADPAQVTRLVEAYRDHRPDITLWPGVAESLRDLSAVFRTAIVTDGLSRMQRRKVAALGVEPLVGAVVYAWDHGPKPDPAGYLEALARLDVPPSRAVVIGDNPGHDMAAARSVGCRSVRVLTGRYAGLGDQGFPADLTVATFMDAALALTAGALGAAA